jgi:DNA primase
MIPPELIQKVRDATDIVSVVSRQVTLKKAGANMKGLCPFHNEKSPSFNVHPAKQIYHCFGCGEGGDVFSFLVKTQKLSFVEALKQLAGEAGIELPDDSASGADREASEREAKEREELLKLLELAADWFFRNFKEGAEAAQAREYAQKRGLSQETLERFQIGYAPTDAGALERAALKKGYSREQLLKCGLVLQNERGAYCRFRGRLMFPIQDARGKVVGFGGRILGAGEPKYLNSPDTALFSKGRLLYALPQAKDALLKKKRALLTEGYMDAIACQQAGVTEAVAVLGTALTEDHARQLKRYVDQVLLVFDADQAGLKAAQRGCEVLLKAGLEPRVVRLGSTKDPDEFLKAKGREAFEKELENAGDAMEFFADAALANARAKKASTGSAQGPDAELTLREKAMVMQELFPLLARYATAMETEVQLRRGAERLGLDVEAVKQDFESFKASPQLFKSLERGPEAPQDSRELSGDPDAEPIQPALLKLERELLELLANHAELVVEAVAELPEPDFSSSELRAAGKLLWSQPGTAVLSFKDDGSEEFRLGESLLSRFAMESGEKFPNPAKHLQDLLRHRQRIQLEGKSLRIKKALDLRPGGEEETRLLAQKSELNVAIQHLKQAQQ